MLEQDENLIPASPSEAGNTDEISQVDPSATDTDVQEPSFADSIESVLDGEESSAPIGDDANENPDEQPEGDEPGDGEDSGEEEDNYEDLPFHKHKRFQELIQTKNELTEKNEALAVEAEQFRDKAGRFEHIENFMETANLSKEDMSNVFEIAYLMRNEPAKALEALKPHLRNLALATGDILPDDLQAKVDGGYMTQEDARAQALGRVQVQTQANENQALQGKVDTLQNQQHQAGMTNAVNANEQEWLKTDPDYARIQPMVHSEFERLILAQGHLPESEEAALNLARQAKETVEAQVKKLIPKKPPVYDPPAGRGGSRSKAEPSDLLGAIRAALD